MQSLFKYLVLALLVVAYSQVAAQNIPNLRDVDVNKLTDAQIEQFIEEIEAAGYSDQQLEVLARARGMSSFQFSQLRRRIEQFKSGAEMGPSQGQINRLRDRPDDLSTVERSLTERQTFFDPFSSIFPIDTLAKKEELSIFGLSFFKNESFTFEPSLNVATPKNYVVGPGDQIVIDIWGTSEQSYILDISPEGAVTIPNLGPVYLHGLTVEKVESRIKSRLKSIYSTLGKTTFAQVSLGQIRTIKVNVVGEVNYPGTYTLSSFATAFNALYFAGGPTESGTLRKINIFRNGKLVSSLDAYDFLIYGSGNNIVLQDQDVVLIPPYHQRVAVEGEVKRPAFYEMLPGESLGKAITFSGGFSESAYRETISLRRNLTNIRTVKTIPIDSIGVFLVIGGDRISVGKISNRFTNRVRVEGAVNFPGEFEITKGMMLSNVIKLADGFRGDAFMDRAVILRETEDFSLTTITFSPRRVVEGSVDLELSKEDLIRVQSIYDLSEQMTITIEGEVQKPGDYPFATEMTVEDIIYLAGGFKESAAKSFVEVARRVKGTEDESLVSDIFNFPINEDLSMSESASDFTLRPFDLVVIRKSPTYEEQAIVEVEGEVRFPGKYVLTKRNERISDLISRAGGITGYAYSEGATLIRRTEFFVEENDGSDTDAAARLRREQLTAQFERDTSLAVTSQEIKRQESIGIDLTKLQQNPGSKFDLIVQEGDIISIPRELQTVRIRGEVLYPATIRFDESYNFKQFISNAGGFTDAAKKKRAYIIYANGSAKRTRSFLGMKAFPKVAPGAEVIIPAKQIKQPLPPQVWIALASSTGTLALIVQQIIRNSTN